MMCASPLAFDFESRHGKNMDGIKRSGNEEIGKNDSEIGKNRRITNRFNLPSLGRHAFRLRESHAGSLSSRPSRPGASASFAG